jgi:hypothetical protein
VFEKLFLEIIILLMENSPANKARDADTSE